MAVCKSSNKAYVLLYCIVLYYYCTVNNKTDTVYGMLFVDTCLYCDALLLSTVLT